MGIVRLITTNENFDIVTLPNENLLEVFRRNNIPILTTLLLDKNHEFVSLTRILSENEIVKQFYLVTRLKKHLCP